MAHEDLAAMRDLLGAQLRGLEEHATRVQYLDRVRDSAT